MNRAIAKILWSYIRILIIKIRASDLGGGPVILGTTGPPGHDSVQKQMHT